MIVEETYTLADGVEIPKLALGIWLIDNENTAQASFRMAKEIWQGRVIL